MRKTVTRASIGAKSLASRLAGVSAFGIGASWKAPEPERDIVRRVLAQLEDKRALYTGAAWEEPAYVIASIENMRDLLTDALPRVGEKSLARDCFAFMRIACRDFMTLRSTDEFAKRAGMISDRDGHAWEQEEFFVNLGKLRQTFGHHIATLGYYYNVDIEERLASILPPENR